MSYVKVMPTQKASSSTHHCIVHYCPTLTIHTILAMLLVAVAIQYQSQPASPSPPNLPAHSPAWYHDATPPHNEDSSIPILFGRQWQQWHKIPMLPSNPRRNLRHCPWMLPQILLLPSNHNGMSIVVWALILAWRDRYDPVVGNNSSA